MLGTITTEDPDRARVAGFAIHLAIGQVFALFYAAGFAALDRSDWWLGALFGLAHAAVALTVLVPLLPGVHPRMASERAGPDSTAVLEPPGLFSLNYGTATPARRAGRPRRLRRRARAVPRERLTMSRREPLDDDRSPRADRRLRADRRHPLGRARGARRFDRLVVRRRASTTRPCSAASSAATRPAGSRSAPTRTRRLVGPCLPARHRDPDHDVERRRRRARAGRQPRRRGRRPLPARHRARPPAHRPRASGPRPAPPRSPLRLRPPTRRRARAPGGRAGVRTRRPRHRRHLRRPRPSRPTARSTSRCAPVNR